MTRQRRVRRTTTAAPPDGPPDDVAFAPEVLPAESGGGVAGELLRGGAALTKVENDSLMQMAIQRPRDEKRALEKALTDLELDPEFAARQWYSIPYKVRGERGGQALCSCDGKKPGHPKEPHAVVEGLSVKAAMALGRRFGNCTVTARVVEETEDAYIVEGVAVDLESLFRVSRQGAVSKKYRERSTGRMVKLSEDRMPQLIGASQSKMARNAVLQIIPEPMRARYWNRARELAGQVEKERLTGGKGAAAKGPGIIESFGTYLDPEPKPRPEGWRRDWSKVRSMIEDHLGCAIRDATPDELADLRGLLNAIESGEAKVEDHFGTAAEAADEATPAPPASPLGASTTKTKD